MSDGVKTAPARAAAPAVARTQVVIVTGMSGAGKSSALNILEDVGYEAIDNLPVSFLGRLLWPGNSGHAREPVAVGVDIRTRDFHADSFSREVEPLRGRPDLDLKVVFLDCESAVIARRFSETRRPHPLAPDRPVMDGIRHERQLLAPVRESADLVIDTSNINAAELRRQLERRFAPGGRHGLTVSVVSFAYGKGLPREADLVIDVRFLLNPHYVDALSPGTGMDAPIARYIEQDIGFAPFFNSLTGLLGHLLPRYREEGKSYLTIGIGCTGGRHRSVFVVEKLVATLRAGGDNVVVRHRELAPGTPRVPDDLT